MNIVRLSTQLATTPETMDSHIDLLNSIDLYKAACNYLHAVIKLGYVDQNHVAFKNAKEAVLIAKNHTNKLKEEFIHTHSVEWPSNPLEFGRDGTIVSGIAISLHSKTSNVVLQVGNLTHRGLMADVLIPNWRIVFNTGYVEVVSYGDTYELQPLTDMRFNNVTNVEGTESELLNTLNGWALPNINTGNEDDLIDFVF